MFPRTHLRRPDRPSRRRRLRPVARALAPALVLVAMAAACGADDDTAASTDGPTSTSSAAVGPGGDAAAGATSIPDETTATAAPRETDPQEESDVIGTDAMFPNGLRDVRYCEVLLLSQADDGTYTAEVYNTLGLNECPQEAWDALDPVAIGQERGVLAAVLNGPRYWTLDTIVPLSGAAAERQLDRFGDLDMFLAATIDLGDELPSGETYTDRSIVRDTIFRFKEGSETYQLVSPDGTVYVMQAYSHFVDDSQTIDSLAGLGDRLELPEGWTFRVVTLDHTVDLLSTDGVATVIQDELQNTYQRVDPVTLDALDPAAQEALTA